MGRIYTASGGQTINANTTRTQLVLTAPAGKLVQLRRVVWSQDGHNAAETVLLEVGRCSTAGSGGSAVTPAPHDPGDPASGSTVTSGPTTEPTYTTVVMRVAINTAIGRDIVWDSGPVVAPGQIIGVRVVNRSGNTNIASPRCLLEWEELG